VFAAYAADHGRDDTQPWTRSRTDPVDQPAHPRGGRHQHRGRRGPRRPPSTASVASTSW